MVGWLPWLEYSNGGIQVGKGGRQSCCLCERAVGMPGALLRAGRGARIYINLYVRISGQLILGDVVSVCYRPPEQEEEAGALFRPHVCRLLSLWQILASMISPGGKIQQDTNNEGDSGVR